MFLKLFRGFLVVILSLGISTPAFAADSLTKPTLSGAKNFMEGSEATITAAAQSAANLTNFSKLETRVFFSYYSTQSNCSFDPGDIVGLAKSFDITNYGFNSVSRTITIPNNYAGYYLCSYEYLGYSKPGDVAWSYVISQRVGVQIAAYQIDWSILAPKIILLPPLSVIASATPTPSASASASASASEIPKPSGYKPTFPTEPTAIDQIQIAVKEWNLKGNEFKSRAITLNLCSDSECKDILETIDVTSSAELTEKTSKTFTLTKLVGNSEQYVRAIDALTYTNSTLQTNKTTRAYSVIVQLPTVEEDVMTSASPMTSTEPSPIQMDSEDTSSNFNRTSSVIGFLGVISIGLIGFVIYLQKKQKSKD